VEETVRHDLSSIP